ncbi:MAG: hypothetical protein J6U17_06185 [Kiritimatiellae bacterium]|nr:hypothetical protein [Kiritimatiellia bacterium]
MKASEILGAIPRWANAAPAALVASPAWAMPCRLGDDPCTMRLDALRPADTLDLAVALEDEPHVLSLADTPRFPELHRLWSVRADVPEAILLALVEKEAGPLLQLIENAAHRQLRVAGLAAAPDGESARLFARVSSAEGDVLSFAITSSPALVASLGRLVFIDTNHPSVREETVPAVLTVAAFTLSAAELASLSVGDALLVPEADANPPSLVADGRLLVDANGVAPFADDGRLRVESADPLDVTLGFLFDHAASPSAVARRPTPQLRLVFAGRTVACGRMERVADQCAFVVESADGR